MAGQVVPWHRRLRVAPTSRPTRRTSRTCRRPRRPGRCCEIAAEQARRRRPAGLPGVAAAAGRAADAGRAAAAAGPRPRARADHRRLGVRGALTVPVGVVDRPFDQLRDLLRGDLSGAGGHVAIAGGPQSGKSTLVRTIITALALTHTPREVQFYCLDFGGGTLTALRGLPHMGGVDRPARRRARGPYRSPRSTRMLARREQYFAELGIDSIDAFRRRRAAGRASPTTRTATSSSSSTAGSPLRQEFDRPRPAVRR